MQQLISLILDDLDSCSREGCALQSGEKLFLIPIGLKADWSFLAIPASILSKGFLLRPNLYHTKIDFLSFLLTRVRSLQGSYLDHTATRPKQKHRRRLALEFVIYV